MKNFLNRQRLSKNLKKLARENAGKPLSVMDDIVFKAMLGSDNEDSREALRSLLSACIRREVTSVRVANNELIPAHLDAKSSRLDVHVTFNDGESADLEMQMGKSDDDLKSRAALYSAMLIAGQSHKGGTYKEIKRVYQIFFLNCILFPQSEKLPRRYSYREETEHDRLTEVTEIIFYEMPKLEQRLQAFLAESADIHSLREDEKWCMYMGYRHEERTARLMEQFYREEAGIMRAELAVEKISRDYQKYARQMAITKNKMDRAQARYDGRQEGLAEGHAEGLEKGIAEGLEKGIAEGKAKGLAEGRAEGIAKEKLAIAQNLKKMGLPVPQIAEVTGLSPETIEQL
jgi:predicted transposase/invertase (TIGR01784 family)